jgi:hypothetical protein
MLHEPLGDDARHDLAGAAGVLSAAVAQRKDVASFRSTGLGDAVTLNQAREQRNAPHHNSDWMMIIAARYRKRATARPVSK